MELIKKMISKKVKINSSDFIIYSAVLSLVGYPISAFISIFFNLPSSLINIVYRLFIVLLCIFFLFSNKISRLKNVALSNILFLLFWFVYFVRLVNDVLILQIPYGNHGPLTILSFAIGSCFIPLLVISISSGYLNLTKFEKYYFVVLFISNLLIFISFLIQADSISLDFFLRRFNVVSYDDEDLLVINTITITFMGELLVLWSLYLFISKNFNKVILFFICGLGLFNMILGASRGPVLGLIIGVIYLFLVLGIKNFKLNKRALFVFFILVLVSIYLINNSFIMNNFAFYYRIADFFQERQLPFESKEARDYAWDAAWNQFLNNPFFGDKIINDFDHYYPHNIYLEVFMSTGLLGAIPFFLGLFLVLKRILDKPSISFAYIIIPHLIFSLISGNLFFNVGFWICVSLVNLYENPKISLK